MSTTHLRLLPCRLEVLIQDPVYENILLLSLAKGRWYFERTSLLQSSRERGSLICVPRTWWVVGVCVISWNVTKKTKDELGERA